MTSKFYEPTVTVTATTRVPRLTKEQAAIICAYTGIVCGPFGDVHEYIEKKMGRPVFMHEIPSLNLKELSKDDFTAICYVESKDD